MMWKPPLSVLLLEICSAIAFPTLTTTVMFATAAHLESSDMTTVARSPPRPTARKSPSRGRKASTLLLFWPYAAALTLAESFSDVTASTTSRKSSQQDAGTSMAAVALEDACDGEFPTIAVLFIVLEDGDGDG